MSSGSVNAASSVRPSPRPCRPAADDPADADRGIERLELQRGGGDRLDVLVSRPAGPVCAAASPRPRPSPRARRRGTAIAASTARRPAGPATADEASRQVAAAQQIRRVAQRGRRRPDPPGPVDRRQRRRQVVRVELRQRRAGRPRPPPPRPRSRWSSRAARYSGTWSSGQPVRERRLHAGRLGVRAGRQPAVGQQHQHQSSFSGPHRIRTASTAGPAAALRPGPA